jgi:hypothetical protein
LLLALSACGGGVAEPTPDVPATPEPPPPIVRAPLCTDKAARLFAELDALLDADGGALWGVPLHGPFMIADAVTREAAANRPDLHGSLVRQGGVYVGTLPQGSHIGTTAAMVYDEFWGMMTWQFIQDNIGDIELVVRIMAHELFHAWQPELFNGPRPGWDDSPHMDGLEERISVMLEINALMQSLRTTGEERLAAIHDALSIRAERRRFHYRAAGENTIEISEGTAVYTDMRLTVRDMAGVIAYFEDYIEVRVQGSSLRMFGYLTGAMYGVLLDELGADWKPGLRWDTDLGALLQRAAGCTELPPTDAIDLERYGYAEIAAFETAWAERNERLAQQAQELFRGPVLQLSREGDFSFNRDGTQTQVLYLPRGAVAYYGSFTYTGSFGQLIVTDGFLRLGIQHTVSAEGMKIQDNRVTGPGWVIWLNDEYEVNQDRYINRIIRRMPS